MICCDHCAGCCPCDDHIFCENRTYEGFGNCFFCNKTSCGIDWYIITHYGFRRPLCPQCVVETEHEQSDYDDSDYEDDE